MLTSEFLIGTETVSAKNEKMLWRVKAQAAAGNCITLNDKVIYNGVDPKDAPEPAIDESADDAYDDYAHTVYESNSTDFVVIMDNLQSGAIIDICMWNPDLTPAGWVPWLRYVIN